MSDETLNDATRMAAFDPAAAEALCERVEGYEPKATEGPWCIDRTHALGAYGVWTDYATHPGHDGAGYGTKVCSMEPTILERKARDANAAFIASARLDLPAAVAHLRAALAERQALLADRDRARERVRELEGEK